MTSFYSDAIRSIECAEVEHQRLERDLATARAEAAALEDAATQMSRAARSLEKKLEAEKATTTRLREQSKLIARYIARIHGSVLPDAQIDAAWEELTAALTDLNHQA